MSCSIYLTDFIIEPASSFDGSNPDYTYFTDKIPTEQDKYTTLLTPNNDNDVMKCMIFNPSTGPGENGITYTLTINTIKVALYCETNSLVNSDIAVRIYEIEGTQPDDISFTALSNANFKCRYVSTTISSPISNVYILTCSVEAGTAVSFNPSTDRGTYFIVGVKLRRTIGVPVYVLKTNNAFGSFVNTNQEQYLLDVPINVSANDTTDDIYRINNASNEASTAEIGNGTPIGAMVLQFDGTSVANNPVCFYGLSLVHTNNGIVHAKYITKNDKLISNEEEVSINTILKSTNCTDIVKISKNSLGKDQPYSDFYVTRTHMIKVNDEELQAQQLVDKYEGINLLQLENSCDVYSFITEKGNYVNINGLNVKTFNSNEFINN